MACSTVNMCRSRFGEWTHSCNLASASARSMGGSCLGRRSYDTGRPETIAIGPVARGVASARPLLSPVRRGRGAARGLEPGRQVAGDQRTLRRVAVFRPADVPEDLV